MRLEARKFQYKDIFRINIGLRTLNVVLQRAELALSIVFNRRTIHKGNNSHESVVSFCNTTRMGASEGKDKINTSWL